MKHIEIFTAGCPVCEPVVKLVKETAGKQNSIVVFDIMKQYDDKGCLEKLQQYGIRHLPAVAVNGQLLDCCRGSGVTKEAVLAVGIVEE